MPKIKLAMLRPRVAIADIRSAKPAPKTVDPFYSTAEHRAWRSAVVTRAGRACEAVDSGRRCGRVEPRMFADHIIERSDGGAPLDPANGQCLCGSHHSLKTAAERTKRHGQG